MLEVHTGCMCGLWSRLTAAGYVGAWEYQENSMSGFPLPIVIKVQVGLKLLFSALAAPLLALCIAMWLTCSHYQFINSFTLLTYEVIYNMLSVTPQCFCGCVCMSVLLSSHSYYLLGMPLSIYLTSALPIPLVVFKLHPSICLGFATLVAMASSSNHLQRQLLAA